MEEVCTQTLDFADAKKVADHLNIKLTKVNFVKEYREKVFNSFLADMEAGITPNPDVLCNRYIKFGAFTDQIFKNNPDIDYVATGHYANIAFKKGKYFLSSALDQTKDQTYFLAEIDKDILHKVKFPLANYTKKEVREIAEKHNIPVMHKEDSMGICFIGERNFSQFLSNYFEPNPGDIVDTETDKVVGQHNGIVFFTIGQRKGLDIGGHHKPYFVTGKDKANNIVYVTQGKTNDKLFTRDAYATNFNLLVDQSVVSGKVIFKVRHSHGKYKGIVKSFDGKSIHIESLEEVHAITPGQELVLYKKGIVLGGGKIISKEHYESI
ncbi:MAG: tRNA 2-thiouridine(34) synthase MnmA [Tenericutes bacterium]|nr:MAG: tRNA 2-thiouridine(34) synthase MnmA [Mycoplasmatota bacterium]